MEWINIKKKYPPVHKYCLLVNADSEEYKVSFVHEREVEWGSYRKLYTHWMPLPKPPIMACLDNN
jgi:hypothetical protein